MSISIGESVCPSWYASGSDVPLLLDGNTELAASTTYRMYVAIADAEWVAFQWEQSASGTGTVASHAVRHTLENYVKLLELGRTDVWAPTPYQFTVGTPPVVSLPAGAQDTVILPISDVQGTYALVEFVTDAAPVTGVRFLAQVRR